MHDLIPKQGDGAVAERAMQALRRSFDAENRDKGGVPDPTNHFVTKWRSNPFTRGSYSYVKLNSGGPAAFDDLAAPLADGRLRFAGEATFFDFQGCVHAAYESGVRESSAIIAQLADLAGLSPKL